MKRLGIFAFYDQEGIVDECFCYLLSSLKEIMDEIIVVSNCKIRETEMHKLTDVTRKIVFRRNIGFDEGAWKDILVGEHSDIINLEDWDEIVLFNDTFYGPFYNWGIVFDEMDKKNVDFWGLDECDYNFRGDIRRCIISYFIAIRKRIFMHSAFKEFWNTKIDSEIKNFNQISFQFEFTNYFQKLGFDCTTWYAEKGGREYEKQSGRKRDTKRFLYENETIEKFNFPVLKIKATSIFYYPSSEKALEYIKNNTHYDISLITKHQERLYGRNEMMSYSKEILKKFVEQHNNIYFFGNGFISKGISRYFVDNNWKIKGYIVSEAKSKDEISLRDINLNDDDGVIVAMGRVYEVKDALLEKVRPKNLLMYKHRSN